LVRDSPPPSVLWAYQCPVGGSVGYRVAIDGRFQPVRSPSLWDSSASGACLCLFRRLWYRESLFPCYGRASYIAPSVRYRGMSDRLSMSRWIRCPIEEVNKYCSRGTHARFCSLGVLNSSTRRIGTTLLAVPSITERTCSSHRTNAAAISAP
jgi:hypothetical protein